jgi:hypothetical protein
MVRTWRKLVWVFEFWNEMLVSNVRCKNLLESFEFQKVLTRILRREGWEINDLSLLSWQFFWNFMTFGWFSKVKSIETDFCFKKTQISRLWYHEMFVFSESLSSTKDMFLLQKINCVFVLAIRKLLHMTKNFVLWCDFCVLITVTESFEKFSLKKSWCLSKKCIRFRNRIFKRFG